MTVEQNRKRAMVALDKAMSYLYEVDLYLLDDIYAAIHASHLHPIFQEVIAEKRERARKRRWLRNLLTFQPLRKRLEAKKRAEEYAKIEQELIEAFSDEEPYEGYCGYDTKLTGEE